MLTKFSVKKATQAAAVLYEADHVDVMTRLRLMKLLYIAEREAVRETATPITGDALVAMEHGPVLSTVLNCINGRSLQDLSYWQQHFENHGPQRVELKSDPGRDLLTPYEVEKLHDVAQRYSRWSTSRLRALTHSFPEWANNYVDGTSTPITDESLLDATGWREERDDILAEARKYAAADAIFGPEP
jgi:uncharacterized phage-associated protein